MDGALPGLSDERSMARLFHTIGKRFGEDVYGKAVPWVRANREGVPFSAVRLYKIADLRAALIAITEDATSVNALFGE